MSRIAVPTEMNAEQKAIADQLKQTIGAVGGPYGAWIHRPKLCERIQALGDYFRAGSALPPKVRMIAVLMTIRHWGAEFPWSAQVPRALEAGLTQAQVTAIGEGKVPSFTDLDDEVAYQVASELLERRSLSESTYGRAVDRLGQDELVELVAAIGHFSLVSLTAVAFQIDPRPSPVPMHKG